MNIIKDLFMALPTSWQENR